MSMKGSLEDVSVPDVLQFVHLGNRSGTLKLERGDVKAEIGFHRGRIISARSPSSKRLGQLLIDRGVLPPDVLETALASQRAAAKPAALGQLLIEMGAVTPDQLREVVEKHVEETVMELVLWTRGDFELVIDEVKPIDDLSVSPGDLLPDIHINTQMVLLEATRIFDERNKDGAPSLFDGAEGPTRPNIQAVVEATTSPGVRVPMTFRENTSESSQAQAQAQAQVPRARIRVQIVSDDQTLVGTLEAGLLKKNVPFARIAPRDAGQAPAGEVAPIVLVDLRGGGSVELITTLRRTRPRATLLAIMPSEMPSAGVFAAGALAQLPADAGLIEASVLAFVKHRQVTTTDADREGMRGGVDKLRRLFGEFRSGLVTATVSVNLMNLISESVDRAVLFLVGRDDIVALGAFGLSLQGQQLAQTTRGFKIKMADGGVLADSIRDGKSRTQTFEAARLPPGFEALLGKPASGQCAVFPLLGSRKVVATVYADNGHKRRGIDDVEFLEIATSQVGMFYENELLRRRLGGGVPGGEQV